MQHSHGFASLLLPAGKKVVSGNWDGAVRLWNIKTAKVTKKWTGHTDYHNVSSMYRGPYGGRVVSGSPDGTFRVWNVESGETIIRPIKAGDVLEYDVWSVCYSPNGTMIAIHGNGTLEVWDANIEQTN